MVKESEVPQPLSAGATLNLCFSPINTHTIRSEITLPFGAWPNALTVRPYPSALIPGAQGN